MRDVFSVRPGRYDRENLRKVNERDAPPAVLQVLIGDPDTVQDLLEQGTPALAVVQALMQTNSGGLVNAVEYVGDYEPEVLMVEAHADVARERNQARIAALVDVGSSDVTILQWFDRAPWDGALPGMPPAMLEDEG